MWKYTDTPIFDTLFHLHVVKSEAIWIMLTLTLLLTTNIESTLMDLDL